MLQDKIGSDWFSLVHNIDTEAYEDMARKRTSLKMLKEQAIKEGKPIFKKIAENPKAFAVLMLFPDGNVRVKIATKQTSRGYYVNIKEAEEIDALLDLLEELSKRKQLKNLLKENE